MGPMSISPPPLQAEAGLHLPQPEYTSSELCQLSMGDMYVHLRPHGLFQHRTHQNDCSFLESEHCSVLWNLRKVERRLLCFPNLAPDLGNMLRGARMQTVPVNLFLAHIGLTPTSVRAVQPTENSLLSPISTHLPKFYSFFKTH